MIVQWNGAGIKRERDDAASPDSDEAPNGPRSFAAKSKPSGICASPALRGNGTPLTCLRNNTGSNSEDGQGTLHALDRHAKEMVSAEERARIAEILMKRVG